MGFLAVLEPLLGLLKGAGIIRTPEDEARLRSQLAEIEARQQEQFVEFIKATTPASADTPRWINGFIAITRPAMVWLVTGSIITAFFQSGVAERITTVLNAFAAAGTAGLAFLGIVLTWMTGRTIEKGIAFKAAASNGQATPLPSRVPHLRDSD